MWFVPVGTLCDRHLRAAHNEVKTWLARRRLGQGSDGYFRQGVWDPRPGVLRAYAKAVRDELRARGHTAPTAPRFEGVDFTEARRRWQRLDPFRLTGREEARTARDAWELKDRCGCGPLGTVTPPGPRSRSREGRGGKPGRATGSSPADRRGWSGAGRRPPGPRVRRSSCR